MGYTIEKIEDVDLYMKCFENEHFFLGTKRPDTINDETKANILEGGFLIKCNEDVKAIGRISSYKEGFYAVIQVAFLTLGEYNKENGLAVKNFVEYVSKKMSCERIFMCAETFNLSLLSACELSKGNKTGILRKNVFKHGKYYDSYIFEWTRSGFR